MKRTRSASQSFHSLARAQRDGRRGHSYHAAPFKPRKPDPERSPAITASAVDIDGLVDVPDLSEDLQAVQEKLGAQFEGQSTPARYDATSEKNAKDAWKTGIALADRSHFGRLRFSGTHRLQFLHSQTTQDLAGLQPGHGADTVFVTSTGRTLDTAVVLALGQGAMAIVSPGMQDQLTERLRKHIFPMDDVAVACVTEDTKMFTLLGPHAHEIVEEWGGKALLDLLPNAHTVLSFESAPVVAVKSSGLGRHVPGWTFIVAEAAAAEFWRRTALKGAVPMGTEAWERARVANGVPAAGAELTELYNPHEAGLLHAVSLAKGCYVGQETLAKIHNTNGVKQQLWGLQLPQGFACAPGDTVTETGAADAPRMGTVTSCTQTAAGPFALAYLRCKKRGEQVPLAGTTVHVHGAAAQVMDLPVATRVLPANAMPSAKQDADTSIAEDLEAKAQAKADKLRQMQEKVAAWQQSQGSQQQ